MSNLVSGDSLEKGIVWNNVINNLFLKGITLVNLGCLFFFPAKLEFRVQSEPLLQLCVCMLTQI